MILKSTRSVWNKFIKFLLVAVLLFGGVIFSISSSSLHAETVKLEKGSPIYYPSWLGNWSTNYYYINGQLAYCLNSSRNEPVNNNSAYAEISNNMELLKVLYYGYGGPEDVFRDDLVTNDTNKYLYTHIMASYAYSGDIYGGKNWDDLAANGIGLKWRYEQIQSMPIPSNEFNFDGSTNFNTTAYYDLNTGTQRTKDIKFNSTSSNTVTLPLQNGIKLHNVTKGTVSINNATIYGGDTFYLETDISNKHDNYSSGTLTGSHKTRYAPLIVKSDSTSVQDIGSWSFTYDPTQITLSVDWLDGSQININKVDNFGENISNAKFDLLQWNKTTSRYEKLREFSYNSVNKLYESDFLEKTDLNEGKFKVEETVPNGYTASSRYEQEFTLDGYIDRSVFTAVIEGKEVNVKLSSTLADNHYIKYEVTGVPDNVTLIKFPTWSVAGGQDDIDWVNLTKESDGVWRANKQMPESGQYVIHIYYNTAVQENLYSHAVNFWPSDTTINVVNNRIMGKVTVTKTDQDTGEKLAGAYYNVIAKNDILTPQGTVINKAGDLIGKIITDKNGYGELDNLNLGEYILKEVVSPEGYHISADQEFTLSAENNDIEIVTAEINATDKANNLKIRKIDKDTGELLKGAEFDLYNVTEKKKVGTYTTAENGEIDISRLSGQWLDETVYYIQEVEAPDGYKLNETKYYFAINGQGNASISNLNSTVEDGTFFIDENGDMTITVKNEINLCNLRLTKMNDNGKVLENAEFSLYSDKECTKEIEKGKTDKNGQLNFDRIVVGDFYLKETKAPDGYRLLKDPIKISLKNVNGKFTFFVNDKEIKDDDKNNSLTLENGLYTGNLTVINSRGSILPATGSPMTIVLTAAGVLCLLITIKRGKNNDEEQI